MKTLVIEWQRLLDEQNKTCPRCGSTEQEVKKAVQALSRLLEESGVEVSLAKKSIDPESFRKDVLQSNRILIAGKQMEEWLGARTGQSKCCETCGDAECRTVEYAGDIHEAIPADMIVRAGLIAAAYLFEIKEPKSDSRIPVLKLKLRKA